MVKIKKSVIAAKRASKRAQRQDNVADNPFEVRVNKKKYEILGRKMKHERGLPGVSRSKALQKREKTLLVEYKTKNKANVFVDRRFGENDSEMTLEDKLLKRFAIEKQKHHEKTGIYNLEEEELTHLGQSLGDFDKFDDVRLSDMEDEDNNDNDAEINFGGFLKKKKIKDDNVNEEDSKPKTRKEIMEEVVAKAKLKKHERQKAKEENTNMTDLLDQDWKDIQNLMSFRDHNKKPENTRPDEYDITVKELAYEAKGKATNRLKTEVEIAKEEQEKLRKLEEERIRRMKGIVVQNKPVHLSADDLGDSFSFKEDTRTMLSYDDGKVNLPDGEETLSYEWLNRKDKSDHTDSEDDDDDDENDQESADEDEEANDDDGDDDHDDSNDEDEENEEEDSGEDLQSDNESEDETLETQVKEKKPTKSLKKKGSSDMTKAAKELPFTFAAPQSYEEFVKLISNWPEDDHITIIERIKACNHPKISPENKAKMEVFLSILLQYMGELADQDPPALKHINKLAKVVFDIAQFSPVHACLCMQNIIKEAHDEYTEKQQQKGGRASYPELKTLLYLQLVSVLFPTSDLKHCVCTSSMMFMSQILAQVNVRTIPDVFKGLFICNIYLEYVSFSKRFVPEVINYLCGVVYLATENTITSPQLIPPFRSNGKSSEILRVMSTEHAREVSPSTLSIPKDFHDSEDNDTIQKRVNAVHLAVQLVSKYVKLYQDLPAFKEVFSPVQAHLKRLPIDLYSDAIKDLQKSVLEQIESTANQPRKHLTLHTKKPEPLKTFTPNFQEHYEIRPKRAKGSKKTNEQQKLKYKLKREFKGAVREVRKDAQFLSRQKLQEQLERDAERMRKVKEIEHLLSNEQAEANVLNRKRRKHKR